MWLLAIALPYCFRSRLGKSGDCTDCAKERTDNNSQMAINPMKRLFE
jgi:hypothetical protein